MTNPANKTDREVRSETMERARRVARMSIETVEDAVVRCRDEIAKSERYDKDLVSHLAWLTAQIVPVMNELRQQDKAELREVARIPLETIVSHLKQLPEAVRQGIAADITGADANEGLL